MYRGYLTVDGIELVNHTRTFDRITHAPAAEPPEGSCAPCSPPSLVVPYRDDAEFFADPGYTDPTTAPWWDPTEPASAELLGFIVLEATGMGPVPISRTINESLCGGGIDGGWLPAPREITLTVLVVACTHAGARHGLQWLACRLRGGTHALGYYTASPQATSATPASLVRELHDVVLTAPPRVTEQPRGYGGASRRHANLLRAEIGLTALNPFPITEPTIIPVEWDSTEALPIVWQTECESGSTCAPPPTMVTDPDCPASTLTIPAAPSLGCATTACLPLCEGLRHVFALPVLPASACGQALPTIHITSLDTEAIRGITLALVPDGGDPDCDRHGLATISYLPPGETLILDAINGRPRLAAPSGDLDASPVVSGPGTGPWSPALIDTATPWTLIMDTAGPINADIALSIRGRDE